MCISNVLSMSLCGFDVALGRSWPPLGRFREALGAPGSVLGGPGGVPGGNDPPLGRSRGVPRDRVPPPGGARRALERPNERFGAVVVLP